MGGLIHGGFAVSAPMRSAWRRGIAISARDLAAAHRTASSGPGASSARMRPPPITAIRSASSTASCTSWVTMMVVTPSRSWIAR